MSEPGLEAFARALANVFASAKTGRNGEVANVVDGLFAIARSLERTAKAIEFLNALKEDRSSGGVIDM